MALIDRYIIKQFILTFLFGIFALCIIFLVVNLLESLDDFLDRNATLEVIVRYYIYYLPEIIKVLTPVSMLISTLFTIGKLSNLNEITAMKSGGMSLYRLMTPLIILSIFISFGQLYFNGWIVPVANQKKFEIEEKYLYEKKSGGPVYNLYFRDNPTRNVIMQFYDSRTKTGNRIAIEDFSSEIKPRLIKRIEANKITWDSIKHSWKLISGNIRTYNNSKVEASIFDTKLFSLNITHHQIVELKRSPEEMNYDELLAYIKLLKRGGKDVRQQMIEYYGNYAFPFANFIVVLFGVPFASVRKKGGIAIQIGAAMIISFLYLVFSKLSQTIGYSSDINPILAGWLANLLFFIFGLITIFKTRT